ncbi:MAG TPA: ribosome biogenesis GTPase Der [Candidatus Hydrogenedens sp.]|nr:ribosome biogenesis GTPase Der [Candidatus Hydrogenedens sp.]
MKQQAINLPIVAICGKPNVGKSTLFNRLAGRMQAIVLDESGITRDRYETIVSYKDKDFILVDTGGIIDEYKDSITEKVQKQVWRALQSAHIVLMVTDGRENLTSLDYEVRDTVIKLNKPVLLIANKIDDEKHASNIVELYSLGLGEPIPISSIHGIGIDKLLTDIYNLLPEQENNFTEEKEIENTSINIAIIGKPNVGKSSLVNALLEDERVIVDETPGTTRDAIDIPFIRGDKQYTLIDTAGMRRKAHLRHAVEFYSVHRTLKAIRRSDVVLVLIEALEGITDQDKKIIGYAVEQGVGIIIGFSKWDLVPNKKKHFIDLNAQLQREIPQWDYIPAITLSTIQNQEKYFKELFKIIDKVEKNTLFRIPTSEFNQFINEIKMKHPAPTKGGKRAKIYYGAQVNVKPTKFLLSVNQSRLFHFSYLRFIENSIRDKYDFTGVPIKIQLKEGDEK